MPTDAERLDFLSQQEHVPLWIGYDAPGWFKAGDRPWYRSTGYATTFIPPGEAKTLREAIDRAIEGKAWHDAVTAQPPAL